MQMILVLLILVAATVYACRRIYVAVKHANDPCHGCQGCELKGKIKEKNCCERKNNKKYLVDRKK
jgi:hypothetical protein